MMRRCQVVGTLRRSCDPHGRIDARTLRTGAITASVAGSTLASSFRPVLGQMSGFRTNIGHVREGDRLVARGTTIALAGAIHRA
jgi:hypothetical protein